jgi:hypothetical protein
MIGTLIGTIERKENYDVLAWKNSIQRGQLKSRKAGNGRSLTQTI